MDQLTSFAAAVPAVQINKFWLNKCVTANGQVRISQLYKKVLSRGERMFLVQKIVPMKMLSFHLKADWAVFPPKNDDSNLKCNAAAVKVVL